MKNMFTRRNFFYTCTKADEQPSNVRTMIYHLLWLFLFQNFYQPIDRKHFYEETVLAHKTYHKMVISIIERAKEKDREKI